MSGNSLIKIDGKPLEKLIDVVSKGIGTLYRPRAIRKEAEAKAYEIGLIEGAKSRAIAEGKLIDADIVDRIQDRLLHKETQRQHNIDNVTDIAAEQLSHEETVSEEPVNQDWSSRFFNIVQDVSDEEMQKLWGRILAGEVKQPESFSLRTIELLKNLSKEEAEIFTMFAEIALISGGQQVVYDGDNGETLKQEFGITFPDKLLLVSIGLIASENNLELSFPPSIKDGTALIFYGKKGFFIHRKENTPKQGLPVITFTKSGAELLPLIESVYNDVYINKIASAFKRKGVTVKFGDLIEQEAGKYLMINEKEL